MGTCASVAKAGAAYAGLAFAAGFLLGLPRVLVLEPRLGALASVAIEAPIMLAVSVLAARWTIRRFRVAPSAGARTGMGLVALLVLQLAEQIPAAMRGISVADQLESSLTPAGLLGLALKLAFALVPLALLALARPARPAGGGARSSNGAGGN